ARRLLQDLCLALHERACGLVRGLVRLQPSLSTGSRIRGRSIVPGLGGCPCFVVRISQRGQLSPLAGSLASEPEPEPEPEPAPLPWPLPLVRSTSCGPRRASSLRVRMGGRSDGSRLP